MRFRSARPTQSTKVTIPHRKSLSQKAKQLQTNKNKPKSRLRKMNFDGPL